MRFFRCLVLVFVSSLASGTVLGGQGVAQEIALEFMSDVPLHFCQEAHTALCVMVHYDGPDSPPVGSIVRLDGRAYVVQWIGPGYYLESGLILEPLGEALPGLQGQRWREAFPREGVIHTSVSWSDLDRNEALSALDTLTLETGLVLKIKDVRLRLRVRLADP